MRLARRLITWFKAHKAQREARWREFLECSWKETL